MNSKSINLKQPIWGPILNSHLQIKEHLRNNGEFQTASVVHSYGQTTTPKELRALGYTHAQIRYGKNDSKVWFGELPK